MLKLIGKKIITIYAQNWCLSGHNYEFTFALAGTTLISCTKMASGFIMSTTGLLVDWVIQYNSPVCPGTSDH